MKCLPCRTGAGCASNCRDAELLVDVSTSADLSSGAGRKLALLVPSRPVAHGLSLAVALPKHQPPRPVPLSKTEALTTDPYDPDQRPVRLRRGPAAEDFPIDPDLEWSFGVGGPVSSSADGSGTVPATGGCNRAPVDVTKSLIGRFVFLWPCGIIPWEMEPDAFPRGFDQAESDAFVQMLASTITLWNDAMEGWVVFRARQPGDPHWLRVHVNPDGPGRNNSDVGWGDDTVPGHPEFQFLNLTIGQNIGGAAHEMGHVIGLAHFQFRRDRAEWMRIQTAADLAANPACPVRVDLVQSQNGTLQPLTDSSPLIDSFDYQGISLNRVYAPPDGVTEGEPANNVPVLDLHGDGPIGTHGVISSGDISRIHQYYSFERHRSWGLFENLGWREPVAPGCAPFPPKPWLGPQDPAAKFPPFAVGGPAIAHHRDGLAMAVRGQDRGLYYSLIPQGGVWTPAAPIALQIASDPAIAVSSNGGTHIVFVDRAGQLCHITGQGQFWSVPTLIAGGFPRGGVAAVPGGFCAPGLVATRDGVAAFVVGRDARLHCAMFAGRWGPWTPVDLPGVAPSTAFGVGLGAGGLLVATYWPNSMWVHKGDDISDLRLVATHDGAIVANTRPAITGSDVLGGYRSFAVRMTGPPAGKFPMLWSTSRDSDWEPIGGIPSPASSPAAASCAGRGCPAHRTVSLVMIERPPLDHVGVQIQPGSLWRRTVD